MTNSGKSQLKTLIKTGRKHLMEILQCSGVVFTSIMTASSQNKHIASECWYSGADKSLARPGRKQATATRKETSYSDRRFWFSYILFIIVVAGILVLFINITRLASSEMFSPSNKIHREVGWAKDLSALQYKCNAPWLYCKEAISQQNDSLPASAEFKPLNMTLSEHQRQAMGLDWMKWKVSIVLFPAFMSEFRVS